MAGLTIRMRLYFDSNAVIRATEGGDDVAVLLRTILRKGRGSTTIATSVIAISETLVGPMKALKADPDDRNAERLVTIYASMIESHTAIDATPIEIGVLFNAAKLRADHRSLKLPDAVHLASAIGVGSDVLISGDRKLLSTASAYLAICSFDIADLEALLARLPTE